MPPVRKYSVDGAVAAPCGCRCATMTLMPNPIPIRCRSGAGGLGNNRVGVRHARLVDGRSFSGCAGRVADACSTHRRSDRDADGPAVECPARPRRQDARKLLDVHRVGRPPTPPAIALRLLGWLRPTAKGDTRSARSTLARRPTQQKASEARNQGAIVSALDDQGEYDVSHHEETGSGHILVLPCRRS